MTATTLGPYEHTGAYRPDVLAQLEQTEPQWSDAPAECESFEPDLTGKPLPSLKDHAKAVAEAIRSEAWDANPGNAASALGLAAALIAMDVHDVVIPDEYDVLYRHRVARWQSSWSAWWNLREVRKVQLNGFTRAAS